MERIGCLNNNVSKPLEATVVDLFDQWAMKVPDRVAVEWRDEALTYGQLRNASLHVSQALLSAGVKPRDWIPVLTEMSLEMLPAVIGILRVGACYVPMDVMAWSGARIEAALSDLSAKVGISTCPCSNVDLSKFVNLVVSFQQPWLLLPFTSGYESLIAKLEVVRRQFLHDDLAWIVFTSGTTGKPKGVMVYHRAIYAVSVAKLNNDLDVISEQQETRCLLAYSIAFDGCAGVVWLTLTKGGTLVMSSPSNFPEVSTTCEVLNMTPSMLAAMEPSKDYDGVRYIYLGGEAPVMEVVRRWISPNRKVITTYGPSETTVTISFGELKADEEPPFGELIPGVTVVLVDENLRECNHGEVLISGPGLAAGYFKNPELTAKKFIQWNGKRFYRTGDLARRSEDGQLVWAGRADSLVKNRGFLINIETEVEPALLCFESVRFAVAFTWRDRLVGCVQPATVVIDELRKFMQERFDPFVIPDVILARDTFPLRANGKTDRDALRGLLDQRMAMDDQKFTQKEQLPISTYEILRQAYSQILRVQVEDLDKTSAFTKQGGNSLSAIQLANFLHRHGYAISVVKILRLNTIGQLEEALNQLNGVANNKTNHEPEHGLGKAPITDTQRLLFKRDREDPRFCALIGVTRYVGDASKTPTAEEMSIACFKVWSAHGIFKTQFDLTDFTFSDLGRVNLDWENVNVVEEEFENACAAAEEKAWKDLDNLSPSHNEVPYCHITCVSVPERKALALINRTHHALVDVFSSVLLSRDVERALAGETIIPGPSFHAFAKFLHNYKRDNLFRATKTFHQMVQSIPLTSVLQLPKPLVPQPNRAFDLVRFWSPTSISKVYLDSAINRQGITPSTIAYAAWTLFLVKITGWDRPGFSISLSGRTLPWPGTDSIVGPLLSRAPFSTTVPAQGKVQAWLSQVHKTTLDTLEFDGLAHSLPDSIMVDSRTNTTIVLSLLDVPQISSSWSYSDKQRHNYLMYWTVLQDGNDVATVLEIQSREVDLSWAESVSSIPGKIFGALARSTDDTLIGDLLKSLED